MRFLIAGAGAIGAYVGACMARAGEDVTLFARGPHLRAMQQRGVRVISAEGDFEARPKIVERLEDAGRVDVIFLGVKAHSLTQLAPQLKPLFREDTTVVSTENGIPWWYFQLGADAFPGLQLERVDPGGVIGQAIEPRRVVGSLVYLATEIAEPGVIRHIEGNRISLGEPDGSKSERSRIISTALIKAGFKCPVTTRIRTEIWVKILGNVAFNPISALTRATLVQMARDPDVVALVRSIMTEVEAVARQAEYRNADLDRPANRRRGKSGRAQDLHAAGSRGRASPGTRSRGGRGAGACRAGWRSDAQYAGCLRLHETA